MRINLIVQLVNGVKGGAINTYGPGLAEVPDGLAKQCLRDGIATEMTGDQKQAIASAKADADADAKADADADADKDAG